eukprot:10341005-Lingulodinium_polyedra.AAC.1
MPRASLPSARTAQRPYRATALLAVLDPRASAGRSIVAQSDIYAERAWSFEGTDEVCPTSEFGGERYRTRGNCFGCK